MLEYHKYAECHLFSTTVKDFATIITQTDIEFYAIIIIRRAKIKSDGKLSIFDFNSLLKITDRSFCYIFSFYDIIKIWSCFKREFVLLSHRNTMECKCCES